MRGCARRAPLQFARSSPVPTRPTAPRSPDCPQPVRRRRAYSNTRRDISPARPMTARAAPRAHLAPPPACPPRPGSRPTRAALRAPAGKAGVRLLPRAAVPPRPPAPRGSLCPSAVAPRPLPTRAPRLAVAPRVFPISGRPHALLRGSQTSHPPCTPFAS